MANKYSKANFVNKDEDNKTKVTESTGRMKAYEERQKRLSTGAKVMAILVALAMIVTAFLSSGVFFMN
jgi:hypothetical protein